MAHTFPTCALKNETLKLLVTFFPQVIVIFQYLEELILLCMLQTFFLVVVYFAKG